MPQAHASTPLSANLSRVSAAPMKTIPSLPIRPRVLSLLGKGGSGKSTTAIQLAGIGASLGQRIIIFDTDPQKSVTSWRHLREDSTVAVHSCRPQEVNERVVQAGKAGFDLALIDNAPVRTGSSNDIASLSDLSLVMVRPSMLDLSVGMDWVAWLKLFAAPFVVVIGSAPPQRQAIEAPFVRHARTALHGEAARVWKGQLTLRHSVIESTGTGATLMESEPSGPAALEYGRLWNAVMSELERTP